LGCQLDVILPCHSNGGGYGRDLDVTVDIHLQTIQLAAVAFVPSTVEPRQIHCARQNSFETV